MKKLIVLLVTAVLIGSLFAVNAAADGAGEPYYFWDFKNSFPEVWNGDDLKVDGNFVYSSDGNIVFQAIDGDTNTDKLFMFINTAGSDQGGASMKKTQCVVIRFKVSEMAFTPYAANIGLIGFDGQEKYVKPAYEETTEFQTWYLDFSGDWTKDAYYLVWFWHEAAKFPQRVEVAFIGGFESADAAEAYVNALDNPPPVTDPVTDPETDDPGTEAPSDPVTPVNADTSDANVIVAVIAVTAAAAGFVVFAKARK